MANGFALHIGRMEWRLFAASVCLAIISLTSHLHRPELRPSTLAFERGTIRTDSGSANVFREVVPFSSETLRRTPNASLSGLKS